MDEVNVGAPDAGGLPLASYDLTPPIKVVAPPHQGVNNESVGIRTGAGNFVWKTYTSYDDAAAIHYEHRLLLWLAAAGLSFAVPAPVPARDGTSLWCGAGARRRAALTPWLPGARRIEYVRNVVSWLHRYEREFVDTVMQEVR